MSIYIVTLTGIQYNFEISIPVGTAIIKLLCRPVHDLVFGWLTPVLTKKWRLCKRYDEYGPVIENMYALNSVSKL